LAGIEDIAEKISWRLNYRKSTLYIWNSRADKYKKGCEMTSEMVGKISHFDSEKYIDFAWNTIVRVCNTVLVHADSFGFQLMHLPDPDIKKMYHNLQVLIPLLEKITELESDPEQNRIVINLRQYLLHLRTIVQAIDNQDEESFDRAIELLSNEAMF
tara:strand:+ start:8866 stop:9336 length:471 start_codon:yes stop_codon:yes gene_type:complete